MDDLKSKILKVSRLKVEEGVEELLSAPEMQPYSRYIEAAITGADISLSKREISELPLEKRYVWRVASALKWGLADFEDWSVVVDRETLQPEDFDKLMKLLRFRPIQMCLFLKALVGVEGMERLMNHAITVAKQQG